MIHTLQEGTRAAGPPVDVAEVFHLVSWLRSIFRNDDVGKYVIKPFWYFDEFLPIASNAIEKASRKIVELGFCPKRVWEVVRGMDDGEIDLVPLVRALEHLPQLIHKGHESCTPGFCDDASKNYTSVTQLHKCPHPHKDCQPTPGKMFDQSLLVEALKGNTMTTAWKLNGMSLVAQDRSYLAVSHVWSDGTGVGAWKAGQVNQCLWDFWVDIARRLECDGVWWDTVCIPQDKEARSKALNNMHDNYAAAKYTVVHDLYLAGMEWKDAESACIALVLSPWFTRGWTALELLLSKNVFVLFCQGVGYTLKDLDNEILAQHPILDSHAHWIATLSVRRLRKAGYLKSAFDILSVLKGRYTSWSRDQSIIAGLMCGLTDHVTLSEQQITKQIFQKIRGIDKECLLHGLSTMSEPQFSWCPHRFVDIPCGTPVDKFLEKVHMDPDGIWDGYWEVWCIPKTHVDRGIIRPMSTDMYVRGKVQRALWRPEEHVILMCDLFDAQGLLVRLKEDKLSLVSGHWYCEYIGGVDVTPSEIREDRDRVQKHILIGYKPGMVDVRGVDVGCVDWSH